MMWLKKLKQRGALFGMDARIALVAMGVAATAIGVVTITYLSENKINTATNQVVAMKNGIFRQCQPSLSCNSTFYTDPADAGMNYASEYTFDNGNDPWGAPYLITAIPVSKTIAQESVTVVFYTIVSSGPNNAGDSNVITNETDYQTWQPAGDDIGIKFSTYQLAHDIVMQGKTRLAEIANRLNAYEKATLETLRTFCDTPANQLNTNCDFDNSGGYTTDEEFQINLFPRATGEAIASKYYSATTYTSGDATGMGNMLQLIGFNSTLASLYFTDALGRTLRYTSNANGATRAPFAARVWYQ